MRGLGAEVARGIYQAGGMEEGLGGYRETGGYGLGMWRQGAECTKWVY